MRRRLMAAMLLLVAGTLTLAAAGSVLLVRRAAVDTAERELGAQARALVARFRLVAPAPEVIRVIQVAGQYQALRIVAVTASGDLGSNLPIALRRVRVDTRAVLQGGTVTGRVGHLVYALVPLPLTIRQQEAGRVRAPPGGIDALVGTRAAKLVLGGTLYFVLLGAGCLLVAGAVGYWLARRLSGPLVTAAEVTSRIAGGDVTSRVPVRAGDPSELVELAAALNTMGERLAQAREQERQFLLAVSHDLRTPLTSITGYADALAEGAIDDVDGAVRVIAEESRRLERMVKDLLDLARLDARRHHFNPVRFDASALVARTIEQFKPLAERSGVELLDGSSGGAPVLADGDRLRQVLGNLVENALRFARHRVTVGAAPDRGGIALWVEDDGPGIAPDRLERVFDRHYTSDVEAERGTGTGSGLGLAIVAELASAMGGRARAISPVGLPGSGGARLLVWLPPAPAAPSGPGQEPSAGTGPSTD